MTTLYIAVTHVDIGNHLYKPGDRIESDPNAEWHLKKGAIRPAEKETTKPAEPARAKGRTGEKEPAARQGGNKEDKAAEQDGKNIPAEPPEEESWEEPEPPELDVTAGLVLDGGEAKENGKPRSKGTKGGRRK